MIVVSNGFNKFHMSLAAAEAYRRGTLTSFITGAYPTPLVRQMLKLPGLDKSTKLDRLLNRVDNVPDSLVHSLFFPEFLSEVSSLLGPRLGSRLNRYSLRSYAASAVGLVRKAGAEGAKLYHYRAGFGHESVIVAKELGMVTLCDHSIAHPAVLQALVDSRGDLSILHKSAPMDGFWSDIMDDITQADAVVVNSDFVKQTFLEQGWPSSRVHVIYLGVDDAFLNNVPQRDMQSVKGPLRLMFGGHFNDRKGADVLVEALKDLNDLDWTLEIAGGITPEMRLKHAAFLRDTRVRVLGPVSRAEMASHMALAEVFIFPSFAEGSARVVFEALACGCYVITTINSGSIVQDGVHGRLTPAGDCNALSESIRNANADRESVRAIGQANAELVRQRHRQSRYGEDMSSLYSELLAEK